MVGRMLDALRGGSGSDVERPLRPNQLRRDQARVDRLRREQAFAARPAPTRQRRPPDSQPAPAALPDAPPGAPGRRHPLAAALASRAGLRQAMLLTEILGPPKALRDPGRDLSGGRE